MKVKLTHNQAKELLEKAIDSAEKKKYIRKDNSVEYLKWQLELLCAEDEILPYARFVEFSQDDLKTIKEALEQ